jgi:hypothetical protein
MDHRVHYSQDPGGNDAHADAFDPDAVDEAAGYDQREEIDGPPQKKSKHEASEVINLSYFFTVCNDRPG